MPRPSWTTVTPLLAAVALAVAWPLHPDSAPVLGVLSVLLVGAVLAAVHHAEVVAHRVGEPYGSLVLAVAVTIIEVGLIVTLMVTTDKDTAGLARDTVFAAVMITVNGIVGLSLLVGALKHHLAVFNPEGTGAALATVISLAVLCLVIPSVTTSEPGPEVDGEFAVQLDPAHAQRLRHLGAVGGREVAERVRDGGERVFWWKRSRLEN